MYGKVFTSMFTGSMVGSGPNVFAVWIYAISNMDKDFLVELNPPIIAAILGCSAEEVKSAIEFLLRPDPESRNPAEEGRSLVQQSAFSYWLPSGEIYQNIRNADERRT